MTELFHHTDRSARPRRCALYRRGMATYNLQYAPPYNTQRLVVLLRAEDGKLLGGILGLTWWGWLRIDILWIDEACAIRIGARA